MKPAFQVPYRRPNKLSDPYKDFSECRLKELVGIPVNDLKWSDYSNLFGPHCPAGTFKEVIYYLPYGFTFLKLDHKKAFQIIDAIFGFCSENKESLEKHGLLETVCFQIRDCLNSWSKDFKAVGYDKNNKHSKGWSLYDHHDGVYNSDLICESICILIEFKTLKDIALSFVESLAYHNNDPTKAAWFLLINRDYQYDKYTRRRLRNDPIEKLLTDKDLLLSAFHAAKPILAKGTYPPV